MGAFRCINGLIRILLGDDEIMDDVVRQPKEGGDHAHIAVDLIVMADRPEYIG